MSKLQMDPPLGGGATPQLTIKVERLARPPKPWTWAIYEDGQADAFRSSTRLYRSAEDAWTVGKAVLERLPKVAVSTAPPPLENPSVINEVTPDGIDKLR